MSTTTETAPNGSAETHDTAGKDDIYQKIRELIKTKTGGKNIGKSGGREVFDLVVAGERRLPSGQSVEFGERDKLRYEEGVVVKALVGNKGDLTEALKVRGSRAREDEEEMPQAPAPTKGAKSEANVELD
jgi:hypothetical protein